MVNKEFKDLIEVKVKDGCHFCNCDKLDVVIVEEKENSIKYKTFCPNCGVSELNLFLYGFETIEKTFNFTKFLLDKKK